MPFERKQVKAGATRRAANAESIYAAREKLAGQPVTVLNKYLNKRVDETIHTNQEKAPGSVFVRQSFNIGGIKDVDIWSKDGTIISSNDVYKYGLPRILPHFGSVDDKISNIIIDQRQNDPTGKMLDKKYIAAMNVPHEVEYDDDRSYDYYKRKDKVKLDNAEKNYYDYIYGERHFEKQATNPNMPKHYKNARISIKEFTGKRGK